MGEKLGWHNTFVASNMNDENATRFVKIDGGTSWNGEKLFNFHDTNNVVVVESDLTKLWSPAPDSRLFQHKKQTT